MISGLVGDVGRDLTDGIEVSTPLDDLLFLLSETAQNTRWNCVQDSFWIFSVN